MKHFVCRAFCFVLAMLCLFGCEVVNPNNESRDPVDQETHKTEEIILAASSLSYPEGSAFSVLFSEENSIFNGAKSALPSCGNAYLNDQISTSVKERAAAFLPTDASLAAVDVEKLYRAEDRYSFAFALYYDLADNTRFVKRFYLSADISTGELLTLGDIVKTAYFENGTVDSYVAAALEEKNVPAKDVIVAAENSDNFFVSDKGATVVVKDADDEKMSVSIYLSDAALALFKRNGTLSAEEPENNTLDNYQPALEGEKVVALTFDDGPGSESTKKLLDYVEANHYKVTFFVNGYNYSNLETDEYAKQTLRRAVSLGCEIGNHSYSHPYFQNLSAEQRTYQLEHNAQLIEAACGVYPNLFRAPGGTFPKGMKEAEDYFYIYWDADGEDWKYKNEGDPQALADRYLNYIGPGSIVLFHDIYANSVDAAIIVMNTLKAQGYRFVTVSELLNLADKVPDGTIYTSQHGTRDYMSVELNG